MSAPTSLDHLTTLADPTRARLLLLLERHELTVGELCAILQLPQSTVSRHLKILGDDGWILSRADGTSRYYRLDATPDEWAGKLWSVVRDDVAASAAAVQDELRERSILAARRSRSREFFSSVAGEWEKLRAELFGDRLDLQLTLALLDPRLTVGDLGCGTGVVSALLAPNVARIVAVDASEAMLVAARARLTPMPNVEVRQGELESLPIADGTLDLALLTLVLHFTADPLRALREAHRTLVPNGRLVVLDMMPHDRSDLQREMGQVWQGFSEQQIRSWMEEAGFDQIRYRPLPADELAKGPVLFAASGNREPETGNRNPGAAMGNGE
jgi:ubiquinone/menaquinone biosynthesis C-methylase UbiE